MSNAPKISVLMAVYNGAEYLAQAIESILNQSFEDFEFIIVDDGSSDETPQILADYAAHDARIKIISQENTGLTPALNVGLKACKAPLIARQDCDDISYPHRLKEQYDFMSAAENSDVVLLGGVCDDLHLNGSKPVWPHNSAVQIKEIIYLKSPFAHSTVMFHRDKALSLGGYDESYKTSQDMEFWMRLFQVGRVEMLKTPILLRRILGGSISSKRKWRQFYDSSRARLKHAPWDITKLKALCYSAKIGLLSALPLGLKNNLIRLIKKS